MTTYKTETAIDYAARAHQLLLGRWARQDEARRLYEQSPEITLTAVGEQMGVTQERVRQMVKASKEREAKMFKVDRNKLDPQVIATMDERIIELEQHIALLTTILAEMKSLRQKDAPLDDLELSMRTYHCMRNELTDMGYSEPLTLSMIAPLSQSELMRCPNFGRRSYAELWHFMTHFGFWRVDDPEHTPRQPIRTPV